MNDILVACFEHNRWANLLLADTCLAVEPVKLEVGLEGTFGPIRPTLAHLAGAEARYLRPLQGVDAHGLPRFEDGHPGMTAIRAELARTGAELIAAARTAVPGSVVRVARRGEWMELPVELFMVQALDHGKEHRTQVAAMQPARTCCLHGPQIRRAAQAHQHAREEGMAQLLGSRSRVEIGVEGERLQRRCMGAGDAQVLHQQMADHRFGASQCIDA